MSDVPAVTEPQSPADLPKDFALEDVVAVARDLAMNIQTPEKIAEKHGLSAAQFEILQKMPFFVEAHAGLAKEWGAIKKAEDRLKFQSLASLEDGLPSVLAGMTNAKEALTSRIEAAKFAAKLAGVGGEDKPLAAGGDKFVIQISMSGAAPVRIEKDITPASVLEGPDKVPEVAEGPAD